MTSRSVSVGVGLLWTLALVSIGSARQSTAYETPKRPADQQAYADAINTKDPASRLSSLRALQKKFPESTYARLADTTMLATLVDSFPERVDEMSSVLDHALAAIPASASPESRLSLISAPLSQLIRGRKLLGRVEELLTDAVDALDFTKYAESQRALAASAKPPQPIPDDERLRSIFSVQRGDGLSLLAKFYVAKGEFEKAQATLMEAIKVSPIPDLETVTAMSAAYVDRGQRDKAELALTTVIKTMRTPVLSRQWPPIQALSEIYLKAGDVDRAEQVIATAMNGGASPPEGLLGLARLAERRGDARAALTHYMTAAVNGDLPATDSTAAKRLYGTLEPDGNWDLAIDALYAKRFPNPIKMGSPAAAPTSPARIALVEQFTGSGCAPCVASDLALETLMKRYAGWTVVPLVYHVHIPAPDPMSTTDMDPRKTFYGVNSAPTMFVDGQMVAGADGTSFGGGGRGPRAQIVYDTYVAKIDEALKVPPAATIAVMAVGDGMSVKVTAEVSGLPAASRDLTLHTVLAERELRFTGENGIRIHPYVVRAVAGNGKGMPLTQPRNTMLHTFDLAVVRQRIVNSLSSELISKRQLEPPEAVPRSFRAEGRAMTEINPAALSAVVFVQDASQKVLQAAMTSVTLAPMHGARPTLRAQSSPIAR